MTAKKATFRICLPEKNTEIFVSALKPETNSKIPRINYTSIIKKDGIFLEISAENTSALRVAINSYLQWLNLIESIHKMVMMSSKKGVDKNGRIVTTTSE